MGDFERRLLGKFLIGDDCWEWTASTVNNGYGRFWLNGTTRMAHRVVYELFVGPIPEGLTLDHLCRNRLCVRPDHLEPVTHGENTLRGDTISARNAAKTHCIHGHPFDEKNTYRYNGHRSCRACDSVSGIRYRRRLKGANSV